MSSCPKPKVFAPFRNLFLLLWWGVVSISLNYQPVRPLLISRPGLLIQYILSYAPYLEAVSFIRKLETPSAIVTLPWSAPLIKCCGFLRIKLSIMRGVGHIAR